ncbi:MAG: glycosyl transferase family 1, partial [Chloroflexi bacterium]|nr:glycosyl transferase family 1 [Chloroflexota bacterium]
DVSGGVHLCLADGAKAFAEAALALAADAPARDRMGDAARETVLRHYDWPVLGPVLLGIYDRLLAT